MSDIVRDIMKLHNHEGPEAADDIVERLRSGEDGLEYAAADEIERLHAERNLERSIFNTALRRAQAAEAERDRLLKDLREIGKGDECRVLAVNPPRCARAARARAALKETGRG